MKEEINDELRQIAPFLADLKKQDPFKTPKFYFDTLVDSVLQKGQPESNKILPTQYNERKNLLSQLGEWISALMQPRWVMAMASVAILTVGSWFYLKKQDVRPAQQLTEVTTDDIHQYIKDNIDDFEEDLLVENDILTSDTEGDILKNISDEDIEQYLKENLDDKDINEL